MTEYETAALVISQGQLIVSALIGAGQIGLIWYGLHRIRVASEQRDRQLDQVDRRLEQQGEVLAELLRRTERPA